MSRSNPAADGQSNPATRFFEWSGSTGKIKYYDKEAKQSYEVDLPFSFLVLDQLNTITGFSKKDQSGYWSNEVRNLTTDVLTVKTKAGVKAEGLYKSQAIANILAAGGKYTKSVYIAYMNDDNELALGHLKLAGSAISAWIEFSNLHQGQKMYQIAVVISDATAAKNGKTDYFIPVFEARQVTPETDAKAKELDKQIQDYLGQYLSSKPRPSADAPTDVEIEDVDDAEEETLDGNVPESDGPEAAAPAPAVPAKPKEVDTGNGQIDIKDVPF